MFVQILVKDTIKVLPAHFGKKYTDALVEAIHAKYANKVRAIA
jgi:DNA-directed RNA polymerase subunit E'/Rpb7